MANDQKEQLRLTVPRRHILVAAATVFTGEQRPILNHICFRPSGEAHNGKRSGSLLTIATNGHKLASMQGGSWEGEWPREGEVTLLPSMFSKKRAKGILDTELEVTLMDDYGTVRVLDLATARDISEKVLLHRYPDIDRVFSKYERYAIARDRVSLDAAYLEDMGKIGALFSDKPSRNVGVKLRRRREKVTNGKPGAWCPVLTMRGTSSDSNRTLRVVLMGTRDIG